MSSKLRFGENYIKAIIFENLSENISYKLPGRQSSLVFTEKDTGTTIEMNRLFGIKETSGIELPESNNLYINGRVTSNGGVVAENITFYSKVYAKKVGFWGIGNKSGSDAGFSYHSNEIYRFRLKTVFGNKTVCEFMFDSYSTGHMGDIIKGRVSFNVGGVVNEFLDLPTAPSGYISYFNNKSSFYMGYDETTKKIYFSYEDSDKLYSEGSFDRYEPLYFEVELNLTPWEFNFYMSDFEYITGYKEIDLGE